MKNVAKAIIGGLSIVGLAVAGYRTYELKKIRKEIEQQQIIEIEAEHATEEASRK